MKRPMILVPVLFLVCTLPTSAQDQSPTGEWIGGYETNGNYVAMKARFKPEAGALKGELDLPQMRETKVALAEVHFAAPQVRFELPRGNGQLAFDGKLSGAAI